MYFVKFFIHENFTRNTTGIATRRRVKGSRLDERMDALRRSVGGDLLSSTWRKRGPLYTDIEVAERELGKLFADRSHPAFVFGRGEKAFLRDLVPEVVRIADEMGWPAFGSKSPPSNAHVEKALRSAGFGAVDVGKREEVPAPTPPPRAPETLGERMLKRVMAGRDETKKVAKRRVVVVALGLSVAPPPREAERLRVTLFRCGCGYVTVDATHMLNHSAACELEHERIPRAAVERVDCDGGFETTVYACADPDCEAGRGKTWLNRQAAHAHRRAHGCELAKTKAFYAILDADSASKS